ncbi:MAG: LPS export ABC transporter permease LptG [Acidiferrobacterales bacterium]
MTILDRHIARSILTSTLLVFSVLMALFMFFKFADALGDYGKANFGLSSIFMYVLLTMPSQIYQLFPMIALLGTTLGLSSLAVDSELIAMRAAGVSIAQIAGASMKIGLVFSIAALVLGEVIAPVTENMAERGRSEALHKSVDQQKDYGVWMRDGPEFIHIGEVLPDLSVLKVNIYQFGNADQLRVQTYAESGRYEKDHWRLTNVRQSWIDGDQVRTRHLPAEDWSTVLAPDTLAVFAVKPESLSAWHLYRYIQHLRQNKQDTGRYELALWNKAVYPLATSVMVILAIPFVFSQLRSSGVGARLMIGLGFGFGFYILNRGFGYFGLLYGLPPGIGAMLPTIFFFGIALVMLRRVG